MSPAVRLVDVACAVEHAGRANLTVKLAGRMRQIERRHVADFSADRVTIPEWLAAELGETPMDRCLTDADVARRFGASVDWVYRNIMKLVAESEFPAPVTHVGRRRYDPRKVDAWFRRDAAAAAAMVDPKDRVAAAARQARKATVRAVAAPSIAAEHPAPRLHAHFAEPRDDADEIWRAALADAYGRDQ